MTDTFAEARARMVERTIAGRGVTDAHVLRAMRAVPRHRFVPDALADLAYDDQPLPIGDDQTISQPYIVALMLELAGIGPGDRVLDVGTGSGYQAAVLAELGADVYTIEIVPALAVKAARTLAALGYRVHARVGDATDGWSDAAPFDAIVLAAAPTQVPAALRHQLAPGGRLVLPVGDAGAQELVVVRRTGDGFVETRGIPVLFVPMTGAAP